jgi:hypothetical protein
MKKSKICMASQRPPKWPRPSEKKEQTWRHHTIQLQNMKQSFGNLNIMVQAKKRHIDPVTRIGSLEINLHIYGQKIFSLRCPKHTAKEPFIGGISLQ